jgi:hypothetical protein
MKDKENSRNRDELFAQLEHILSTSKQKFDMRKASNATRQKWARIIVQAIQVYGKLLDGAENEAILKKIDEIEKRLGVKK